MNTSKAGSRMRLFLAGMALLSALDQTTPRPNSYCHQLLLKSRPLGCACYALKWSSRGVDEVAKWIGYYEVGKRLSKKTDAPKAAEKATAPQLLQAKRPDANSHAKGQTTPDRLEITKQ